MKKKATLNTLRVLFLVESVERIEDIPSIDLNKYDFKDAAKVKKIPKGLSIETVKLISKLKQEPEWMLEHRLKSFNEFLRRPMPVWGADLSGIDFQEMYYYITPEMAAENAKNWEDVPGEIKDTFEKLGIPEAERKYLAGSVAQYESTSVYANVKKIYDDLGVIFMDMDSALKKHPDLVKKYFMKCVPYTDNKFAALHGAVWSGGSFLYVPKGVKVDLPFQTYFRMNAANEGQFEHTLIVAEEGSEGHYVEGCFVKGTPVKTETSDKPIEEVTVGEKVLTHENRFKTVYHTQVRPYSGKLYSVTYYGDSKAEIKATEEHPFLVVKKERAEYKNTTWNPDWSPVNNIQKGDYLAMPIDREVMSSDVRVFNVNFGKSKGKFNSFTLALRTDKDFFRLLGYYLSEGTTIGGHYVSFTFNVKEKEYLEDVKFLLLKYFEKEPIQGKIRNNGISLTLCSTKAARFFNSEFNHHAHTKQLPLWVIHESPEKQAELIKGFWRGDGSYMYQQYSWGIKRMFRMNTVSSTLARQLRDVLLRLDVFAGINSQERANKHVMHTVYVGGSFLQKFANVVNAQPVNEFAVERQIALQKLSQASLAKSYAHITEKYAFVPVKTISFEEVVDLPVYNFSVDEDESYVAGGVAVHNCTAPKYTTNSLHSAIVEIFVHDNAKMRYTTVQNWSKNVYNLNTKRAIVDKNAKMEWVGGSLGSKLTMLYPMTILKGDNSSASHLNIAFGTSDTWKDGGAKVLHIGKNTTSKVIAKSISSGGGVSVYRGLLRINAGALNAKSHVQCDALILDKDSRSDTYPHNEIYEPTASFTHEASVGKISDEQLFYMMSRGLNEADARSMIVLGFLDDVMKEIPLEFSVELNRLIHLEMEKLGAVG
ncbi:Fe-S cluster assembly protein SufB [Candidatus Micrarchaeota archaeon]|nr:Fe-S cluster assembly protein SufB [Candidatus Micrarchaeota archaeon]